MPMPNEPPSQVSLVSARDSHSMSSQQDREVIKVVTTAGTQSVDKEFLTQLLTRKDVIPARKRRDFIPNDLKDDHYWERRRKNNLAAKRSREKRRMNDIVLGKRSASLLSLSLFIDDLLETKVVELTNANETLKAKLHLMLSRLNMKESDMENIFEEEQRLGHICLKPATIASLMLGQRSGFSDDDEHSMPLKNSSASETHDDDRDEEPTTIIDDRSQLVADSQCGTNEAVDLSRTEVKTGNLLTSHPNEGPSPLTPSPSPPNESLLQILANQMWKGKHQESSARLLKIASPMESKSHVSSVKRSFHQVQQDDQQQKWDEAAMTLLSLNKPPVAAHVEQQTALQSVCQSVINGLLRKPTPAKATIDYHSSQHSQGENLHHPDHITSLAQWKTLMNYFSAPAHPSLARPVSQHPSAWPSDTIPTPTGHSHPPAQQQHEQRADMMPLKLRMKMLNAKS